MGNFSRSAFTILEIDLARRSAPTHYVGLASLLTLFVMLLASLFWVPRLTEFWFKPVSLGDNHYVNRHLYV